MDKYHGDDDVDYVHVDEPQHVHVLGNLLLLGLIFLDYELGFDFVFHKHHYIPVSYTHLTLPTRLSV